VLGEIVASGRWLAQPADDALDALDSCAGPELAAR
jgi:hypothetical protein